MIRTPFTLLLLLLLSFTSVSQNSAVDPIALKIPQSSSFTADGIAGYIKQNFTTDEDRIRAIYVWIANNINYDLNRFQFRLKNPNAPPQPVEDVLRTRSAVCHGYVDLFVDLCSRVGVKALLVGGYTKNRGTVSPVPHAWVAAELDGNWYLFDPTWGAGHVNNGQFVKSFNNTFYKVLPQEMIKHHMPFDPLYQFLTTPITNQEFIDGRSGANTARPYFNYRDTLARHAQLLPAEKLSSELRRVEANGVRNELIMERVTFLRKNLQEYASQDNFAAASEAFKKAAGLYNQYIDHKNKQFTTISDTQLQQMIDSVQSYAKLCRSLLAMLVPNTDSQKESVAANFTNLEKFQQAVMHEKDFVAKYIATDRSMRKQLFLKK